MAPSNPPPYWTYNQDRLLTMAESVPYEEAIAHQARQQQARRGSEPQSQVQTSQSGQANPSQHQASVNRRRSLPLQSHSNASQSNTESGNGVRSVDMTDTPQISQQDQRQQANGSMMDVDPQPYESHEEGLSRELGKLEVSSKKQGPH